MNLKDIVNYFYPKYEGPERRKNNPYECPAPIERRGVRQLGCQIIVTVGLLAAVTAAALVDNYISVYKKRKAIEASSSSVNYQRTR